MRQPLATVALALALAGSAVAQEPGDGPTEPTPEGRIEVRLPRVVMRDVPFDGWLVAVDVPRADSLPYALDIPAGATYDGPLEGAVAGGDSVAVSGLRLTAAAPIAVDTPAGRSAASTRVLPGWLSVLPPVVAIAFALAFRQVVISLLAGVWLGALFVYDWKPVAAVARTLDTYLLRSITDPNNAQVLVFTLLLGGMVGIISRNGGTYGVVDAITRRAVGPIRGQLAAYAMGLLIFFDDYSNTLIVGSTMRPVTDRLRISREKLAYIVDSTAAPVASIALISGWIGVEVGLINGALQSIQLDLEPYVLFLESIPFRFYPVLALFFVFLVIVTDRDYGPMLTAELRARREGKVLRDGAKPASDFDAEILNPLEGNPRRWVNAIVPILVVGVVTIGGMIVTGRAAVRASGGTDFGLQNVVASGDSFAALVWGSFAACVVAVVMTLGQRLLSLEETMSAWLAGLKAMLFACVILALAWSIGNVTTDVYTAGYVVGLLTGNLDPRLLPVIVFVMCAFISFATGTSWGTMAIMMPIVVPLAVALSADSGLPLDAAHTILVGSISGVLAGAVWGDHCSPISDTTILSSMASSADHIDHVRTQIPYALAVGVVGMLVGDIPTAYGLSPWISIPLGIAILWGILRLFGRRVDEVLAEESAPAG